MLGNPSELNQLKPVEAKSELSSKEREKEKGEGKAIKQSTSVKSFAGTSGSACTVQQHAVTSKCGWELLQVLFAPSNNHRAYRDALERTSPPCILSVETLLDDLKTCDEHETNFEVSMNVLQTLGLDYAGLGFESDVCAFFFFFFFFAFLAFFVFLCFCFLFTLLNFSY
jgi:hypothetical protein